MSPWETLDYLWVSGTAELQWLAGASWPGFSEEVAATALGLVSCTPCHLPPGLGFLSTEPEQVVSYEVCPQTSDLWVLHHVGRHRKFEVTQFTPHGVRDTACSVPSHLMPFCGPWTAREKTLCFLHFGCLPR